MLLYFLFTFHGNKGEHDHEFTKAEQELISEIDDINKVENLLSQSKDKTGEEKIDVFIVEDCPDCEKYDISVLNTAIENKGVSLKIIKLLLDQTSDNKKTGIKNAIKVAKKLSPQTDRIKDIQKLLEEELKK